MSGEVEQSLRTPGAYGLAHKAVELMERHQVWPTALNYELFINVVAHPASALAREVTRILEMGEAFTDQVAEELAAAHLPKLRLNEQIRDAGDALSKELATVSEAIATAQKSSAAYGKTLAGADRKLDKDLDPGALKAMVADLSAATERVQAENKTLEIQLSESTAELGRLREHLEQVRRDATTDGLTNLANRKAFDEEFARACAEAEENGESLTLALIDIDHFKNFNDTWGHQTGDQVIRYVASVIGRLGAPPRLAARHGGEEFAIIFPGEVGAPVTAALEEIRMEVGSRMLKRRSTNEDLGAVTVSAGIAERRPGESMHSVMERADSALYASKRTGRNRVTVADDKSRAA
ncbi:MAG: diguanylate cyclase [Caulobacteraceae bacterium]|nr:diguanylate cyclase [Caulobacteraceae bacterium]